MNLLGSIYISRPCDYQLCTAPPPLPVRGACASPWSSHYLTVRDVPPFQYQLASPTVRLRQFLDAHLLCITYSRPVLSVSHVSRHFSSVPITAPQVPYLSLTFWPHLQSYRSFSYSLYINFSSVPITAPQVITSLLGYERH